jgi:hypothetical protein
MALVAMALLAGVAIAGDPIPGIDVHLKSSDGKVYHAKTDADGAFSFTGVPEGTYSLFVSNKACRMAINTKGTPGSSKPTASRAQLSSSTGATPSVARDWTVDAQPPTFAVDVDKDGMPDVVTAREASSGMATGKRSAAPRDAASGMATGRKSGSVILIGDDCDDKDVACATVTFSSKKEFKGHVTLMK